jgi:hypothetical protein
VNELVDPLQIVWPVSLGKAGEERTVAKLRSIFLRVVKQPLHSFSLYTPRCIGERKLLLRELTNSKIDQADTPTIICYAVLFPPIFHQREFDARAPRA